MLQVDFLGPLCHVMYVRKVSLCLAPVGISSTCVSATLNEACTSIPQLVTVSHMGILQVYCDCAMCGDNPVNTVQWSHIV